MRLDWWTGSGDGGPGRPSPPPPRLRASGRARYGTQVPAGGVVQKVCASKEVQARAS
jgi:hypothetical protein